MCKGRRCKVNALRNPQHSGAKPSMGHQGFGLLQATAAGEETQGSLPRKTARGRGKGPLPQGAAHSQEGEGALGPASGLGALKRQSPPALNEPLLDPQSRRSAERGREKKRENKGKEEKRTLRAG